MPFVLSRLNITYRFSYRRIVSRSHLNSLLGICRNRRQLTSLRITTEQIKKNYPSFKKHNFNLYEYQQLLLNNLINFKQIVFNKIPNAARFTHLVKQIYRVDMVW